MSSTSIRISGELAASSKAESTLMHRSLASQVEHWACIGRAIEHSGQFDYNHIARALKAEIPVDDLSAYEKPVFDELHDEAMQVSSDQEKRAHQRRLQAVDIDTDALGD
jgi:hypothetical protein